MEKGLSLAQKLIEELRVAKKNVVELVSNRNASIDMKGLVYWAKRVEYLREQVEQDF